jgi:hypothetical protein
VIRLENVYRVHRLFQTGDPVKLVADIGPSIRAVVTGGAHGISNAIADALPALEIIAINLDRRRRGRPGAGPGARGAGHDDPRRPDR